MELFRLSQRLRESSAARDSVQRFSIRNPPIGNDSRETLLTFENMSISARIEKKLIPFSCFSLYFGPYISFFWQFHTCIQFDMPTNIENSAMYYISNYNMYFYNVGGFEIITIGASLKLVFVGHVNANWIVIFNNSHVFSGYSSCGKYGFVQ